MTFYGAKESGKTCAILNIVKKIKHKIDNIFLFTIVNDNKERYKKELGIPETACWSGFDDENTPLFIEKLIKYQEETKRKRVVLLIFDDILDSKNAIHSSSLLGSLYSNHRHLGISIILSSQQPTAISPRMRMNCNYVFVLYSKNKSVKDIVQSEICSSINPEAFYMLFEKATSDHNMLVIDTIAHDN